MATKTLIIHEIVRREETGGEDTLTLYPGVNILVGQPNTGKSKWLRTIDYLLGDDLSAAERTDPDDIFTKYTSATALLQVAGEEVRIERRWTEHRGINKVFINDEAFSLVDYRAFLMEKLSIPVVHYPQGDPYSPRSWPEVGWRSLMRHAYRRQKYWNDLADQQPEVEQHACLMQFLGVGVKVFSSDYGQLVRKNRRIMELQGYREQFMSMLQEVSREVVSAEEVGLAVTPSALDSAASRLKAEETNLHTMRASLLDSLRSSALDGPEAQPHRMVDELSERLVAVQNEQERTFCSLQRAENRKTELEGYCRMLAEELVRLQRAGEAGSVLADLKVTHCPACDQELLSISEAHRECYVCKQPTSEPGTLSSAQKRLEFELEQLKAELDESEDLLQSLTDDIARLTEDRARLASESLRLEQALRPVRSSAAAILPPELAIVDMNIGRVQEQARQIERIQSALGRREELARQIAEIQVEVVELEQSVSAQTLGVDFESLADLLADGMNDYLGRLKQLNADSWTQQEVNVQLSKRDFRIRVGKSSWKTKLGGTLGLYFLLAYHYSLMKLSQEANKHYPGLFMVDFPAEVNGVDIGDKENFVLEPFIELLGNEQMKFTQIIAAGSSFENLQGVHRTELKHVWK